MDIKKIVVIGFLLVFVLSMGVAIVQAQESPPPLSDSEMTQMLMDEMDKSALQKWWEGLWEPLAVVDDFECMAKIYNYSPTHDYGYKYKFVTPGETIQISIRVINQGAAEGNILAGIMVKEGHQGASKTLIKEYGWMAPYSERPIKLYETVSYRVPYTSSERIYIAFGAYSYHYRTLRSGAVVGDWEQDDTKFIILQPIVGKPKASMVSYSPCSNTNVAPGTNVNVDVTVKNTGGSKGYISIRVTGTSGVGKIISAQKQLSENEQWRQTGSFTMPNANVNLVFDVLSYDGSKWKVDTVKMVTLAPTGSSAPTPTPYVPPYIPSQCTPGKDTICEGAVLMVCNSAGTGWTRVTTCAWGCECTSGRCKCTPYNPSPTQPPYVPPTQPPYTPPTFPPDVPPYVPPPTQDNLKCEGDYLMRYNENRNEWEIAETCTWGCDATTKSCASPAIPGFPIVLSITGLLCAGIIALKRKNEKTR